VGIGLFSILSVGAVLMGAGGHLRGPLLLLLLGSAAGLAVGTGELRRRDRGRRSD
jgi:hypothetical protein